MKKITLYLGVLMLAFGSGIFLENIFASVPFQADVDKKAEITSSSVKMSATTVTSSKESVKETSGQSATSKATEDKTEKTVETTSASTKLKTSKSTTSETKEIKSVESTKETKEHTATVSTAQSSAQSGQEKNQRSKNVQSTKSATQSGKSSAQLLIQPAPVTELKALQTVQLQNSVASLSHTNTAFQGRDLTPTINHEQKVNHLYLTANAVIYQNPSTKALKVADGAKYRGFTAISRKSVENEMGIWYQVAFPDTVIGWVQEKQTQNRNQDYYFYTTGGPKPNLALVENLAIEVSIAKKRVYVKSGDQIIYTMLCQTARDGYETPTGHYQVNDYRATSFWSTFGGADYAVGWKDGGLYLFHSIDKATNEGPYVQSQGLKLGVTKIGTSHGCIQLAIEDAKWFYQQLPVGTPVSVF